MANKRTEQNTSSSKHTTIEKLLLSRSIDLNHIPEGFKSGSDVGNLSVWDTILENILLVGRLLG